MREPAALSDYEIALADVIRGEREQQDIPVGELFVRAGIPESTGRRYLNRIRPMTIGHLRAFALALGVPAEELLKKAEELEDKRARPDA